MKSLKIAASAMTIICSASAALGDASATGMKVTCKGGDTQLELESALWVSTESFGAFKGKVAVDSAMDPQVNSNKNGTIILIYKGQRVALNVNAQRVKVQLASDPLPDVAFSASGSGLSRATAHGLKTPQFSIDFASKLVTDSQVDTGSGTLLTP